MSSNIPNEETVSEVSKLKHTSAKQNLYFFLPQFALCHCSVRSCFEDRHNLSHLFQFF